MVRVAIIVGGPAGTGKTTVGAAIADQLGASFIEGDSVHPQANIEKMSQGIPLTDEDRWDWLAQISQLLEHSVDKAQNGLAVASCSSLAVRYRKHIRKHLPDHTKLVFVFLYAQHQDVIFERVGARKNHYMGAKMVESQFQTMEVPARTVDVAGPEGICLPVDVGPLSAPEVIATAMAELRSALPELKSES